jgi:lipopolysaccharide export system ATP-binding protein
VRPRDYFGLVALFERWRPPRRAPNRSRPSDLLRPGAGAQVARAGARPEQARRLRSAPPEPSSDPADFYLRTRDEPGSVADHGRYEPATAWDEQSPPRWDDDDGDRRHEGAQAEAATILTREPYDWQDSQDHAASPPARRSRWDDQEQAYLGVQGVEKTFVGRKVVKGVTLYVRRGEAVGLLGPNGAGKTTVFYMITGLIKADRGRIELDGHDITALPMYQRGRLGIGYLPQEASIFRGLTVEENIRAVLEVVEPSRRKREADLDRLLDEFNIGRLRKTPSIALSGGERRRVEIARALATRPSYMLLDEPFAGIDPIAVGDIQALVRHLTQRGIGVLITDHNVRETLGLTDRAYIIYSGEVLMEGNTSDIVNDPEVRRLYLGEEFRL